MPAWLRSRLPYAALAVTTIVVGLIVHLGGTFLPSAVRDATGDALWAMMMAWWLGAAVPTARVATRGSAALTMCFAVEASQLYHAPALDALRRTTAGHLVLGSGFDPRDLLAYTVGVLAAVYLERALHRRRAPATAAPTGPRSVDSGFPDAAGAREAERASARP